MNDDSDGRVGVGFLAADSMFFVGCYGVSPDKFGFGRCLPCPRPSTAFGKFILLLRLHTLNCLVISMLD
jgi:hypothetical protein